MKRIILIATLSICMAGILGCGVSEPETPIPEVQAYNPTHITRLEEIHSNPAYWNMAWEGMDYELQQTTREINSLYFETHTYVEGETDCNDMAIDIWNMLQTQGITSIIVFGSLESTGETFAECNHAWLLIYNSEGGAFALEPTNGELYFAEDVEQYPELEQYWAGYFYTKPSDLRADLKERW